MNTTNYEPFDVCCESQHILPIQGRWVCINCGIDHAPVLVIDLMTIKDSMVESQTHYGERTQFKAWESTMKSRGQFIRMKRINESLSSSDSSLQLATQLAYKIGGQLDFPPSFVRNALIIYKQLQLQRMIVGRSLSSILAGAFYIVSIQKKYPCQPQKLADAFQISLPKLRRSYHIIAEFLTLKISQASPLYYIHQFSSSLYLTADNLSTAVSTLNHIHLIEAKDLTLPNGTALISKMVAAAIIYIVSLNNGKTLNQQVVSQVAKTSEVTLRKYVKIIKKMLGN